jgi:hypothetical protein
MIRRVGKGLGIGGSRVGAWHYLPTVQIIFACSINPRRSYCAAVLAPADHGAILRSLSQRGASSLTRALVAASAGELGVDAKGGESMAHVSRLGHAWLP